MDFSAAKIIFDLDGKPSGISVFVGDIHLSIPMIESNTDYQTYLEWIAEGNEPSPPEQQEGS